MKKNTAVRNDQLLEAVSRINPEGKPLTPEILKTFPGCKDYTDHEALEIVHTLEKLSAICYGIVNTEKIYLIDNQQVVYLNSQTNTKTIAA